MREWISQMAGMARLDKKIVDDKVQSYQLFVLIVNGIVVLLRDGLVYLILIWLTLKGDHYYWQLQHCMQPCSKWSW